MENWILRTWRLPYNVGCDLRSCMPRLGAMCLLALTAPWGGRLTGQQSPALPTPIIAARATPATVTILTFGARGDTLGQGSGFVVRSSGVIVTNWHVLAGAQAATVTLASGERYERVLFLDGDSTRDVALIQIPGAGLSALTTRDDLPPVGSRVVVIGSPLGLPRTVTEGVISAIRLVAGQSLVQISAPISPGSSGGPVMDDRGRAFAIASAFLAEGQQLNFAVPLRDAMGLLALHPTPRPLSAAPTATAVSADPDMPPTTDSVTWDPPRAARPRRTMGGTFIVLRRFDLATTPPRPVTVLDLLVLTDSGRGWMGWDCDSTGMCSSVVPTTTTVAPSGALAFDNAGFAWDGYQTDSGFVAQTQFPKPDGGPREMRIRGWQFTLPLSRRTGRYECNVRTQYVSGGYRGDFTDWSGDAVVLESRERVYLFLNLTNARGGTTGGHFMAVRRSDDVFEASSGGDFPNRLTARWYIGRLMGDWEDVRRNKTKFVGTLSCSRK
jgi:trypsin-like peptidase